MQLNEPTKFNFNVPTLADKAMLVRLTRSMYQPYAFDRNVTEKVNYETGVRKAGRFNKRLLLDCYQLRETNAAFNDVYQYTLLNTVPWLDDGFRMFPADRYFDFQRGLRELMDEANRQADRLAAVWDVLVADDMSRLGSLANSDDYPRDIRQRYSVAVKFMPIPTANDFRVAVSDEDRQSLNDAIAEAEANVTKYLIGELLDPIKRAVEKLAVPIGDEGSIFRDSLLVNITEQVERARNLNLGADPRITELCDSIKSAVGGFDKAPDMLREDISARQATQEKLAAIARKMGGIF
jgi:hypothetical protein